jgi:hypothetical protein
MIDAVTIDGYRGFAHYEMSGLGRVNLLVGKNNSGKTSVLEALYFLSSGGDPSAIWQLCARRGERIVADNRDLRYGPGAEIDVSHLFRGHDLAIGQEFSVAARNRHPEKSITVTVGELSEKDQDAPALFDDGAIPRARLALHLKAVPPLPVRLLPLSRRGGLSLDVVDFPGRRLGGRANDRDARTSHYISTDSLDAEDLVALWDKVQLTPKEGLVLRALRFVDPTIDQVRSTGSARSFGGRGGFIVKRRDEPIAFPLGSLGDGAWRMLAMAIVLTQCENGTLFVDEIDTGLHYTVMEDMWRLVFSAAKEFNVQVFATTHSYDCVHSISSICRSDIGTISDVTIQRIEANKSVAVPFTEAEIRMAADRQIEIR